ncbi:hypothetical protein SteCoe_34273 [Stentor coeruleus]|uniref:Peroxisomal biogenesis factor 11 n=1 Tax=Stentor coeruleus TaxID=5963 RepID=A0A1R2AV46_9CILI|nr:hypothetical protein SteCoe_34273 [Stentor coeruleus]
MLSSKEAVLFLEKVEAKELLIRATQYFAFLIHALLKNSKYQDLTKKSQKISGNLSIVRKVLRFGMPLGVFLNIRHRFLTKTNKPLKLLGDMLSLLFYFSDHLLYFYRVRLLTLKKDSTSMQIIDVIRNLAWVSFLLAKIADSTVDIHKVQKKILKLAINENRNYLNTDANERFAKLLHQSDVLVLGIISDVLDIPVALYFLDPSKINPVLVGTFGVLSSIVHIYKMLIKHRQIN